MTVVDKMNCLTVYDWMVALSYSLAVGLSYASQLGVFGLTNKQVSDDNPTPLTPAPWAFAIWGTIFSSQLVVIAYLLLRGDPSLSAARKVVTQTVGPYWALGWLCEGIWQVVFVKNTRDTHIIGAVLLVIASGAFAMALKKVHASILPQQALPKWSAILVMFSTALNAAWLSVAAALSILIALGRATNIHLTSPAIALALLVVAKGAAITYSLKDPFYGLTLCWAFAGIYAEQNTSDKNTVIGTVASVAILASATVSVLTAVQISSRMKPLTTGKRPLIEDPNTPNSAVR